MRRVYSRRYEFVPGLPFELHLIVCLLLFLLVYSDPSRSADGLGFVRLISSLARPAPIFFIYSLFGATSGVTATRPD